MLSTHVSRTVSPSIRLRYTGGATGGEADYRRGLDAEARGATGRLVEGCRTVYERHVGVLPAPGIIHRLGCQPRHTVKLPAPRSLIIMAPYVHV